MDPIAKTAYYCAGARAWDARQPRPVCGDTLAERFMDPEARQLFTRFEKLTGPNSTNAARHRIIDDLLRERLAREPETLIVLVGAGFDTRGFRLPGGRWVELDQPALLARKEAVLPAADAPNPITRVGIEFGRDRLGDKLGPWAGTARAVVVMEGVTMYLDEPALRETLETLRRLLPGHTLLCDLMTRKFADKYGASLRRRIQELGGDFAPLHDRPQRLVTARGYRQQAAHSIPGRAAAHGAIPVPGWLLGTFLRPMRDGYRVFVFA